MFYSERLRLRAVTRADLPLFVEWFNDPQVTAYLRHGWPLAPEDEEAWFERLGHLPREERPLVIEVRRPEGWQPIGNGGLRRIHWRNRSAEVAIAIGEKDFWDQGYGTEALSVLLHAAFDTLNLHRVWLHVQAENQRAIAAYRKLGFVEEGRLRQAEYRQGRYVDLLVMSILRPEWARRSTPGEPC